MPPALAAARGIADTCIFTGRRDDVIDLAHAFDVVAQSSDTEGTSNTLLEAMALEIPVVATDVGGTSDIITDRVHGRLVPRRDAPALAKAIDETLDGAAETAAMVAAARRRVENELSFAVRMRAVERIYEDLMNERCTAGPRAVPAWGVPCERD